MKRFFFLITLGMVMVFASNCAKEEKTEACIPQIEVCDGMDNDCNGEVDDGNVCTNPRVAVLVQPPGYVKGRVDMFNLLQQIIQPDVLTTGVMPNQMVMDGDYLYIINSSDASLQRVKIQDLKTDRWFYLPQGSNPWSVAIYQGRKAFISGWLSQTVEVVDLETGEVRSILLPEPTAGMKPYPLAVTISGNRVYVAESANDGNWPSTYKQGGAYAVIDADNDSLIKTEDSGVNECLNVQQVVVDENSRTFIVCAGVGTTQLGRVVVKDSSGSVIGNIATGNAPTKLYFNSGKGYITDMFGPNIMVIDTTNLIAIRDGNNPVVLKQSGFTTGIAITPAGMLYATLWDSTNNTNLFSIDPETYNIITSYSLSGPGQDVVYIE